MTITRREALELMALAPLAIASSAPGAPAESPAPQAPRFFTAHEWRTVRVLANDVMPRDERSGSATEAGVPEFMDFILLDQPDLQLPMRGGLAWLDAHADRRFGAAFADGTAAQRASVLDEIAWPTRARPDVSHGVAFFSMFRDLTASGFWTSRIGVTDLRYWGNTVVHQWDGCPPEALAKLGVSY